MIYNSFSVVVSGAGSGVCELTSQSRLDIQEGALKGQKLKQSISDRRGIQCCSIGQYEITDVFFEHWNM